MVLKTFVFAALIGTLLSNAHAKGFMGYIGPFDEYQTSTERLPIKKCDPSLKEIQFSVSQDGKYHIPRIFIDSIEIQYSSGKEETLDARDLGEIRRFKIELAPTQGCMTSIALKARAGGFNPGRTLASSVEVWGY